MGLYFGKIFMRFQDFGISEVYGIEAPTLPDADAVTQNIIAVRLPLLCPDVTIQACVTSDTDIRGDSQIGIGFPLLGTYAGEGATTYDPTNTMLYRVTSTDMTKRALRHLRFIPDDQFDTNGTVAPTVGFTTPRATFFDFLRINTVILTKITGAVAPPFYSRKPIGTVTYERGSHKKVGRPFALPVGRRQIR